LQHSGGIIDGGIDVNVRAQILRQLFLLGSAPDRDSVESHFSRELDTKMPKAANALHSDQVSAAQAGIAKSVVGRDTRAKEWSGFRGPELIRDGSDPARFSDHHFGVSSIHGYAGDHGVLTIHNVSAPARFAHPIFAAEEADTYSLTDLPFSYSSAQGFNAANYFMPGNARQF
jgi:hypothetical protein